MSDPRDFIKVHDCIGDHPKIEPLSDAAFRVLVTSWGWCHKHNTDGRMPLKSWEKRNAARVRAELVSAGLVIIHTDEVEFHDYLEHQQSAAQRASATEQRRSAGRAGGLARGKRTASEPLSDSPSEIQAEVEVEVENPSGSARKRATSTPDLFPITAAMAQWGKTNAPLVANPKMETARFLDYHRAKGSAFKDWTAAWRTWMGNAQTYALRDTGRTVATDQGNPATAWAREQ